MTICSGVSWDLGKRCSRNPCPNRIVESSRDEPKCHQTKLCVGPLLQLFLSKLTTIYHMSTQLLRICEYKKFDQSKPHLNF